MKKCPFCAEEIQDEAIKCRFCGSFLNAGAPGAPPAAPAAPLHPSVDVARPPFAQQGPDAKPPERKLLYFGSPSWRAYLGHYLVVTLIAVFIIWLGNKIATDTSRYAATVVIVIAGTALYFAGLHLYRRSIKIRVTSSNIEYEHGILSKKIDVLELWRCRDIRYQQSIVDRIIRIAHIHVYTADVTSPQLELFGLPASRKLFEQIRDNIEIQRQSRNVYGVVS